MTPSRRIGFISTRFAGTDGVSLETAKWATVLERLGHICFYFCGESDRPLDHSFIVPEAFYRHPLIDGINQEVFTGTWGQIKLDEHSHLGIERLQKDYFSIFVRPSQITEKINELKEYFKKNLYDFVIKFELELLIVENALTIPINIPLGLAITEFIAETGFPVIAHHHDFSLGKTEILQK